MELFHLDSDSRIPGPTRRDPTFPVASIRLGSMGTRRPTLANPQELDLEAPQNVRRGAGGGTIPSKPKGQSLTNRWLRHGRTTVQKPFLFSPVSTGEQGCLRPMVSKWCDMISSIHSVSFEGIPFLGWLQRDTKRKLKPFWGSKS